MIPIRQTTALLRLPVSFALVLCAWVAGAAAATPIPSVVVTPVVEKNVSTSLEYVGHVVTIQSVELVPRVTAFIEHVAFKQGSDVKAGQVLFKLQKSQYEAVLQSAEASLASAQAALENANLVANRDSNLNNHGFSPASTLDQDVATRNEDAANVMSATASVSQAQLNLGYCTITAPISGRIGAVKLTKGNLVTPTTGALATINQLNPIRVVFSVPTDSPLLYPKDDPHPEGDQPTVNAGNPAFDIQINLPNGKPYPQAGKIDFIDNEVSSTTGTINVYANFSNPKSLLLPGAYVTVMARPAKPKDVLVVPVAAVQTDQSNSFALVVGSDHKVQKASITLGAQVGEDYIVKSGLAAGQQVIVDGIQKVTVGQPANISEASPAPGAQTGGNASGGQ